MAISWMATRDQDSINPTLKGLEDEEGVDPSGARDSDHPDAWGILDPGGSCEVSSGIRTPVTEKG
jgi:hypothetical protein